PRKARDRGARDPSPCSRPPRKRCRLTCRQGRHMANLFETLGVEARDPHRIFAVRNDRPDITYGDLADASARYANALASHGVAPGDRVVVQVEKCIEMLFLYLGCLRAGAVFLPAN